jgi:hypothetical protein
MAQHTFATALPTRLAAFAAFGLLLTACGNEPAEVNAPAPESAPDETGPSASPGTPSEGETGGGEARTRLTIERTLSGEEGLEPAEGYEEGVWTLTCSPAGGDHPEPEAACAEVEEAGADAFTSGDTSDMMCTMQVGGPEVVHVTGHVGGTEVDTEFNKRNGCEIERFESLSTVFNP